MYMPHLVKVGMMIDADDINEGMGMGMGGGGEEVDIVGKNNASEQQLANDSP